MKKNILIIIILVALSTSCKKSTTENGIIQEEVIVNLEYREGSESNSNDASIILEGEFCKIEINYKHSNGERLHNNYEFECDYIKIGEPISVMVLEGDVKKLTGRDYVLNELGEKKYTAPDLMIEFNEEEVDVYTFELRGNFTSLYSSDADDTKMSNTYRKVIIKAENEGWSEEFSFNVRTDPSVK